jgi:hypothetical protein
MRTPIENRSIGQFIRQPRLRRARATNAPARCRHQRKPVEDSGAKKAVARAHGSNAIDDRMKPFLKLWRDIDAPGRDRS